MSLGEGRSKAMSDLLTVLAVTYAGLCAGTLINVSHLDRHILDKLLISVFAPIPVFLVLVWAATSIAKERFNTLRDCCGYPLLLVLSLAMYAEAVTILTHKSKRTGSAIAYKYKDRVPIVREAIATNYVTA